MKTTAVNPRSSRGISNYALYSEAQSADDPEFIHIEDIRSRARLFDWTINIHVHPRMYQLIYVRTGHVRIHIDGEEFTEQAPCIITIPPSVVHGFEFGRENTDGSVITVSQLVLLDEQFQRDFPFGDELLRKAQVLSLRQHPDDTHFIEQIITQMEEEYRDNRTGKKQMFEWLLYSLLLKVGRRVHASHRPRDEDHYERLYRQLVQRVEHHYREHKPATFYAEQLHTTTTSLNRACASVSGKNVSELLHDRLTLEAQRMLIYSSVPVSLIAYDLGFADPAYFSRFFKRRTGVSPSNFRELRDRG
ncbi:Transcriptional regulator, AraC family [Marinobacterium lacunae]|uniref:Transcriptional regulator, AraC family n=1 Tax=Marinobacterium lacunae TaxID=1232683 RepID=A0A081G4T0_9GAMM|nr:helix-turn-helix domain-containing protein [Marinobacterium lacunae]KEA65785.1 Transcriptional regulator, AraC family [Marinobacterium lacunae]MBR9883326.1 helix-turn-helix domain-containing protein [Oceanospirillales bacterium]